MAVNKIDFATGGAPTSLDDYVAILANLAASLSGGSGKKPITNFGTTSTPQIAQSAFFVAGGVLYQADSDTAISGSISANRYIEMVPSGSPTGATLTPTWTATEPTWSTAYDHFVSGSGNLVLNVMRDQDGYNTIIDIQDFVDVGSGTNSTAVTLLGELGRLFYTKPLEKRIGPFISIGSTGSGFNSSSIVVVGQGNYGGITGSYCDLILIADYTNESIKDAAISSNIVNVLGNNLSVAADTGNSRALALYDNPSSTSAEVVYSSIESIRMLTYTFDTSTVQTGNTYTTTETSGNIDVCILPTSQYIIRYESENETLQGISWDGSDFTIDVTSAAITGAGTGYLLAWDSSEFILVCQGLDEARAYSYNGSSFTLLDTFTFDSSGTQYRPVKIDKRYFFVFGFVAVECFTYKDQVITHANPLILASNISGTNACKLSENSIISNNGTNFYIHGFMSSVESLGVFE